jgi:hypothetical protein
VSFHESVDKARDLMRETRSPGMAAAHRIEAARVHAELAKAEAMNNLASAVGGLVQALGDKS